MPLSSPVSRELIHTRKIICEGYRRNDGLWDIDARLTDAKNYAFENSYRGTLGPGDHIHDMVVRITVDDSFVVQAVEVHSDATPYAMCPGIAASYQQLVGLRVASGWRAVLKQRVGGIKGCTHLTDLMQPVAVTVFQTIAPILAREKMNYSVASDQRWPADKPPPILNTCHAYATNSPVVKTNFPQWYRPDDAADGSTEDAGKPTD